MKPPLPPVCVSFYLCSSGWAWCFQLWRHGRQSFVLHHRTGPITHTHNKSTQFTFSQRVSFYFLCVGGGRTEHQDQNRKEVKHLLYITLQRYRSSSLHVQLRIGATMSLRIVQVLWGGQHSRQWQQFELFYPTCNDIIDQTVCCASIPRTS